MRLGIAGVFLLAGGMMCAPAQATELGQIDGFDVQWDTTVRETLGFRTESADPVLLGNINADDGDRAFDAGLISARMDLYTELTATRDNLGFDVSAQGWYDPRYYQGTANTSPQTFNPAGVSHNQFPNDVRTLMGQDAELVDAFVRDRLDIDDVPVTIRLGRQTVIWGESLFFADNGIAAGQAPVDSIKAQTAPLAEARELYLPVTQIVARVQLEPGIAVEAYDQFEWRRDRLPGVSSYFSTTDILDAGGNRILQQDGKDLYRTGDSEPHGLGQFGVALRLQGPAVDYGLYALRYDAKLPEPVFDTAYGTYHLVFPGGIDTLGASASGYVGDSNIAGEISVRHNMPLAASGAALAGPGGGSAVYEGIDQLALPGHIEIPPPTFSGKPGSSMSRGGYATGNTWHGQTSIVSQLPPSHWWQGASFEAEIAVNDLIGVTGGHGFVQPGRTHFAAQLRAVFTPSYYQVVPGLDIGVPIGLNYTAVGRSSIDTTENRGAGYVSIGITAAYRVVWLGTISFTHFIGGAGAQALADRDFALASVTRSF